MRCHSSLNRPRFKTNKHIGNKVQLDPAMMELCPPKIWCTLVYFLRGVDRGIEKLAKNAKSSIAQPLYVARL